MKESITTIHLPSHVEMADMPLSELIEWRDKLLPYYEKRAHILAEHDHQQYYKARQYETFKIMIENVENKQPRWHRISGNYD